MVWAPDSPDLWAPDSAAPNRRAPDSGGHLTLGRAVDLFLAAKAAEGAAANRPLHGQRHVALHHVERRVAEDPLEAEHVTAVGSETCRARALPFRASGARKY
jgi:hypothetical protein